MERRAFETPGGRIWLWAEPATFDGEQPVVLVIRGAIPAEHDLEWLAAEIPDCVFAHLPGFHSPLAARNSMALFIAAFDAAIAQAFAGRQVLAVGSSAGAIVAAGLRAPQIVARVLIEPFFSTAKLRPLVIVARGMLADPDAAFDRWVWDVLGIAPDRLDDRDYSALLTGDRPLYAVVGDVPLEKPLAMGFPSFVDDADRARLTAAGADIRIVPGGHDVSTENPGAIVEAVRAGMRHYA